MYRITEMRFYSERSGIVGNDGDAAIAIAAAAQRRRRRRTPWWKDGGNLESQNYERSSAEFRRRRVNG